MRIRMKIRKRIKMKRRIEKRIERMKQRNRLLGLLEFFLHGLANTFIMHYEYICVISNKPSF